MTIRVTDGGGKFVDVVFNVVIEATALPPRFINYPADDFSILENLTDDTIITRIKVFYSVNHSN